MKGGIILIVAAAAFALTTKSAAITKSTTGFTWSNLSNAAP